MRIALDILVIVAVLGVLAGIMVHHRRTTEEAGYPDDTRAAVRQLQDEVNLHAALEQDTDAFPDSVDPAWFEDRLPRNPLLDGERPWLEVAGEAEWPNREPRIKAAFDATAASFWYNPNLGIVRARVPGSLPESEALNLYNYVNGTNLESLFH